MTSRLPPLKALHTFEVAARHQSFKKAAEELHVTPAAVSQQIKILEDWLGTHLFHRSGRQLRLTTEALSCLPLLQGGFEQLTAAVDQLKVPDKGGILTVSVTPAFAAKWLVPRLHRFTVDHPDIDMRISASMALIDTKNTAHPELTDFQKDDIDVAIRFGRGQYPGFRVDKLLSVFIVPLCNPRLQEGEHPLRHPTDLRYHTLLHDHTLYLDEQRPDWAMWLKTAGIEGIDTRHGLHFAQTALALEAAVEGQGVVLGMEILARGDIEAGRLVIPFQLSMPLTFAYYLMCPEEIADKLEIVAFRRWILKEAQQDRVPPR